MPKPGRGSFSEKLVEQATGVTIYFATPPIGKESLFNQITYLVRFTNQVPGIWWDLDSGHHFDVSRRRLSKLGSVNPLMLGMIRRS